ncbi:MAG: response regulator [Planctomycetota bacterium]
MKLVLLSPAFRRAVLQPQDEILVAAHLDKPMKHAALLQAVGCALERETAAHAVEHREPKAAEQSLFGTEFRRRVRLLLVEDNPTNQQLMQFILSKAGYGVEVAGNGLEAISKVSEHQYDVILMDCQMPEMDGFEATRRIRGMEVAHGSHIPILAMTANVMQGYRERCFEAGMDDYISKPIQPKEMLAWLEKWLQRGMKASGRLVSERATGALPRSSQLGRSAIRAFPGREILDTPLPVSEIPAEPAPVPLATAPAAAAVSQPLPEPPAPLPSPAPDVLDRSVLDCLFEDEVGRELAKELIQAFADRAPEFFNEVDHALMGQDYETAASVAHKFVSTSGRVGAVRAAKELKRLEGACRGGELGEVPSLVQAVRREVQAALEELSSWTA